MQKLCFTADTHFDQPKVILYCRRPFKTKEEMNEYMIAEWNRATAPDDYIYHLGDFSFRNLASTEAILKRLNGRKFLCIGSHDRRMLQLRRYFEEIKESFFFKISKTQFVFLNHYLHKTWPRSHYGSWHLYGHSHGRLDRYAAGEGKLLDVGVDAHGFRPWTLEEVIEAMKTRPWNFNDVRDVKT